MGACEYIIAFSEIRYYFPINSETLAVVPVLIEYVTSILFVMA
jgi:hypothetical protein